MADSTALEKEHNSLIDLYIFNIKTEQLRFEEKKRAAGTKAHDGNIQS